MFGWFKKERKSDLYYELELALQDKSRWVIRKNTYWGYRITDTLTKQEWVVSTFLDSWYVAEPSGLAYEYDIGNMFYEALVREYLLRQEYQKQVENKEREGLILKQYQEVK